MPTSTTIGSALPAGASAVPPVPRLPTEPNDAVRSTAPPSTRLLAFAAKMLSVGRQRDVPGRLRRDDLADR